MVIEKLELSCSTKNECAWIVATIEELLPSYAVDSLAVNLIRTKARQYYEIVINEPVGVNDMKALLDKLAKQVINLIN